ncbi:MAG TPA: hypothetical protein VL691_15220 [Vicinamibacteria bacterium]|nr:hypothetical protein [Vicinamibacteria bacterium]
MRPRRGALLAALLVAACRSHDPAKELALSGVETYWIVDSPQRGENYVSPTVRFRLKNVGPATIGSIQARARFPAPDQDEVWGSIQEQVSTWSRPLERGREVLVTVRSAGRYHSPADPEDMLRSPAFKDPRVEVFVRIGSSNWALLAEAPVTRQIGAPEVHDLVAGR